MDGLFYNGMTQAEIAYPVFRNYELEWDFIKEMDRMGEIKFDQALVVIDCNPNLVGENWILVYEAENDNALSAI